MENMLRHNIMLFPSGNNKMVLVTIVDSDFIKSLLPEDRQKDNISFTMATTRVNIGDELTMKIDTANVLEGEEWAKKCEVDQLAGMGISGIITSPVWFCQKIRDAFNGLF